MGALAAGLGGGAAAQEVPQGGILVVSRKRVLAEAQAARTLADAEIEMTTELQSRVDAVKRELADEEAELARLRPDTPNDDFDARVRAFDARVRRERQQTQRRAAALQSAFRAERQKLVDALGALVVEVAAQKGALLVLDLDDVLLAHPTIDVTDEVLSLFDARMAAPALPDLDALDPGSGADAARRDDGADLSAPEPE